MPLTQNEPDALAMIYAKSLFELADKRGGRDAIEGTLAELEEILELARQNPRFGEFLASRALSASDRAAALERIFKGRASDLVKRFLLVLNDKGRLAHLPTIVAGYDNLVQARFGRVEVDAYTAKPMTPDEANRLKSRLGEALRKEVILHGYTDAHMIGGLKLRIGDQFIDASVATKLRKMKDQLATDGLARLRARFDSALGS